MTLVSDTGKVILEKGNLFSELNKNTNFKSKAIGRRPGCAPGGKKVLHLKYDLSSCLLWKVIFYGR